MPARPLKVNFHLGMLSLSRFGGFYISVYPRKPEWGAKIVTFKAPGARHPPGSWNAQQEPLF